MDFTSFFYFIKEEGNLYPSYNHMSNESEKNTI